jgi:two-component system, cell cycle response regulator DivK
MSVVVDRCVTGQLRVLLVDSYGDSRQMYAEWLRREGFRVCALEDTSPAAEMARHADIIVTGIRLRGPFDGVELVRRLRADRRTRAKLIVVLSACAMPWDRRDALDAGCDAFLSKPCPPTRVVEVLSAMLAVRGGGAATDPPLR